MLPTARLCCNISSKEAVLPRRKDAEMGPANLLQASAYYSEYNEKFWFDALESCFAQSQGSSVRLALPKVQISLVTKIFQTHIFTNLPINK